MTQEHNNHNYEEERTHTSGYDSVGNEQFSQLELVFSAEEEALLRELTEIRGDRDTVSHIVSSIVSGESNCVVFSGEPGSGKTAVARTIANVAQQTAARDGKDLSVSFTLYDDLLDTFRKRIGNIPSSKWSIGVWQKFNEEAEQEIYEKEGSLGEGTLHVVELPAVGDAEEKRGVGIRKKLIHDLGDKGIFVHLAPDRINQMVAGYIRSQVERLPETEIVPFLARFGIEVEGGEDMSGAALKDYFGKMGQKNHIHQIRTEEDSMARKWMEENPSAYDAMKEGVNEYRRIQPDELLWVVNMINEGEEEISLEDFIETKEAHEPSWIDADERESAWRRFISRHRGAYGNMVTYRAREEDEQYTRARVQDQLMQMAESYRKHALNQALYHEHLMRDVEGLSPNHGIVLFNPYHRIRTSIDISSSE